MLRAPAKARLCSYSLELKLTHSSTTAAVAGPLYTRHPGNYKSRLQDHTIKTPTAWLDLTYSQPQVSEYVHPCAHLCVCLLHHNLLSAQHIVGA